jgi:LuxR family maltose regulon positive regulatory protein
VPDRPDKLFELFDAKLAVPAVRPGIVARPGLVNRLRAATGQPLVTVVAPAGYGKTSLLSQWAERDERVFAWVSLDERDDDPAVLLRYLAAALERADVLEDATGPARLATLATGMARAAAPFVVVLDDVHRVGSRAATDAIATLARHIPEGSALVLAGRTLPELPVPRDRAAGRLLELGADELTLSRREAQLLMSGAGVELGDADVTELTVRTEGWAAGLHLAALFLRDRSGSRRAASEFTGADRFVADYFAFEYLDGLGEAEVRFLTRASILDSMCGPLCDAVLGRRQGSARKLGALERSSAFVVPIDRQRVWYRFHNLFRDTLRSELARREPELVPELNRRAAAWCEANDAPADARRYAAAAGDLDTVARLVAAHALPALSEGRVAELESWLDGLDDAALLERYPAVAVLGSWIHALADRPERAGRWLEAAERAAFKGELPDGTRLLEPWIALARAAFCRDGVDRMLADAETAAAGLARSSRWRPTALVLKGIAHLLLGDDERADDVLAEAAEAAASVGATATRRLALAERSLLATAVGDHSSATELAAAAADGRRPADVTRAIELAASARAELRAGDWHRARADIEAATPLALSLGDALPWLGVQASLELARAHIALLDVAAAGELLSRAESILERFPSLGALALQTKAARAELRALVEEKGRRQASLTAAELRLLPLLTTRLSFREIGERLHVSRHTVKTQAIAIYRKFGVSSRNEAIHRASELGLVDVQAQ